jgi:hypothetical protein
LGLSQLDEDAPACQKKELKTSAAEKLKTSAAEKSKSSAAEKLKIQQLHVTCYRYLLCQLGKVDEEINLSKLEVSQLNEDPPAGIEKPLPQRN